MATYQSSAVTGQATNIPAGGGAHVAKVVLDFSTTNLGTSESIDVFQIPAETVVLTAGVQLITASGNAGTLDLGDSESADFYVADIDADSATAELGSFGGAKAYIAADEILLKGITAAFDGKVRVVAVMAPLGLSTKTGEAFA